MDGAISQHWQRYLAKIDQEVLGENPYLRETCKWFTWEKCKKILKKRGVNKAKGPLSFIWSWMDEIPELSEDTEDEDFDLSIKSMHIGSRTYWKWVFGENNQLENLCQLLETGYNELAIDHSDDHLYQSDVIKKWKDESATKKIEIGMIQFSLALALHQRLADPEISEDCREVYWMIFGPNNYCGAGNSFSKFKRVFLREAMEMAVKAEGAFGPMLWERELWTEENFGRWRNSPEANVKFAVELDYLATKTQEPNQGFVKTWPHDGLVLAYPHDWLLLATIDQAAAIYERSFPAPNPSDCAWDSLRKLVTQSNWSPARLELLTNYPDLAPVVALLEDSDADSEKLAAAMVKYNDKHGREDELHLQAMSEEDRFLRQRPELQALFTTINTVRDEIFPEPQLEESKEWSEEQLQVLRIGHNLRATKNWLMGEFYNFDNFSDVDKLALQTVVASFSEKLAEQDWSYFSQGGFDYKLKIKRLYDEVYTQLLIDQTLAALPAELDTRQLVEENLRLIGTFCAALPCGFDGLVPAALRTWSWIHRKMLGHEWEFFQTSKDEFHHQLAQHLQAELEEDERRGLY